MKKESQFMKTHPTHTLKFWVRLFLVPVWSAPDKREIFEIVGTNIASVLLKDPCCA
jgi:hypothetical protein